MAYDEDLAARLRVALAAAGAQWEERKMFGGLAFMVEGAMTLCASGPGGLMVKLTPESAPALVDPPAVDFMVMRGRPMKAWLYVEGAALGDDAALQTWVDRALAARAEAAKG